MLLFADDDCVDKSICRVEERKSPETIKKCKEKPSENDEVGIPAIRESCPKTCGLCKRYLELGQALRELF